MSNIDQTKPQVIIQPDYEGELPRQDTDVSFADLKCLKEDANVSLARTFFVSPAMASEWRYEETEKAPEGAKEMIAEALEPYRVYLVKTGMLGCFDYGYQGYETTFEVSAEGFIIPRKIKQLLSEFTFVNVTMPEGDFDGLLNNVDGTEDVNLTTDQCLLYYLDEEGTNWYGRSILRRAKAPVDAWNSTESAAQKFDAKVAGAYWIIEYPVGATIFNGVVTDNQDIAAAIGASLKASGTVLIPNDIDRMIDALSDKAAGTSQWSITLEAAPGVASSFDTRQRYLDSRVYRALGFPERSVTEGQFGTKAEAEVHGNAALTNVEMQLSQIVRLTNWHYINRLLRLNYGVEAENTVYAEAAPLADSSKEFYQKLYELILTNPVTAMDEAGRIDTEALRDTVAVPSKPETDVDEYGAV